MVLRDNYFGTFTHFSTLDEYIKKPQHERGDPIELQYRAGSVSAHFHFLTEYKLTFLFYSPTLFKFN